MYEVTVSHEADKYYKKQDRDTSANTGLEIDIQVITCFFLLTFNVSRNPLVTSALKP